MGSYHVASLAGGAGKDEDHAGALGLVAFLEVIPGGAAYLAGGESRSSGGAAGEESKGGGGLHVAGFCEGVVMLMMDELLVFVVFPCGIFFERDDSLSLTYTSIAT